MKNMIYRNTIFVFVLTFLYSILRYNIFGEVPIIDIPTFIVNKAIAFSMIIILLLAVLKRINKKDEDFNNYLNVAKILTIIHVLITLSLMSQNYYPKLFLNEKLTLFGNLSVLSGVLAFVFFIFKQIKIGYLVFLFLTAIHLFFIGFKGWLTFEKWNGMMPPITLFCFIIVIFLFILSILNKSLLRHDYQ
jgi:hypothetical protein